MKRVLLDGGASPPSLREEELQDGPAEARAGPSSLAAHVAERE